MKFTISKRRRRPRVEEQEYFCTEPWTGILDVMPNGDVNFCPCYLQMKIGNVNDTPMAEIWNSEPLIELRGSFREGRLPEACRGQSCPVVLGEGTEALVVVPGAKA
jgi:radical SAM protein with 4Fe4S-binding SPASM domain